MIEHIIPLTMAKPENKYVIRHIATDTNTSSVLKGYGIFPGSIIKLVFCSPANDPCAYEIMGSVIALRRDLSKNIFVFPLK